MADNPTAPQQQKLTHKVLFDPTITLGHIITTFALMGGLFLQIRSNGAAPSAAVMRVDAIDLCIVT